MNASLAQAVKLVREGRRFLLTCHVAPDADAVGSMLGLAELLIALGKDVYLYNRDPIPETLRFLPRTDTVQSTLPQGVSFDATLVTDTAARSLLPRHFPSRSITGPVVILDHHVAHDDFGDIVVRDVNACATALVVLELATALGVSPLPAAAAAPLYTALVADTGGFRYPGTTPQVLRIAADLLEQGVDAWRVASQVFESWSMSRMRLLGLAVNTIQTAYDGKVAIVTIPLSMLELAGASDDMAEGLVEYGRMLRGVEIAIMLWERRPRAEETLEGSVLTRLSLRSAGTADVSRVAVALGGGGHRTSAGATVAQSLAKAREIVLLEAGRELGLVPR
ncbi:MAG TPA: DHH family phosphoesterase [Polyangiales bacterium]|nr:DHH family phosphoesterase [Polyangiales bacterium]